MALIQDAQEAVRSLDSISSLPCTPAVSVIHHVMSPQRQILDQTLTSTSASMHMQTPVSTAQVIETLMYMRSTFIEGRSMCLSKVMLTTLTRTLICHHCTCAVHQRSASTALSLNAIAKPAAVSILAGS